MMPTSRTTYHYPTFFLTIDFDLGNVKILDSPLSIALVAAGTASPRFGDGSSGLLLGSQVSSASMIFRGTPGNG